MLFLLMMVAFDVRGRAVLMKVIIHDDLSIFRCSDSSSDTRRGLWSLLLEHLARLDFQHIARVGREVKGAKRLLEHDHFSALIFNTNFMWSDMNW